MEAPVWHVALAAGALAEHTFEIHFQATAMK